MGLYVLSPRTCATVLEPYPMLTSSSMPNLRLLVLRYIILLTSLALYLGCLGTNAFDTPGYTFDGNTEAIANPGWSVLMLGWVGVLAFLAMISYPIPYVLILFPTAFLLRIGHRRLALAMAVSFAAIALYERALPQAGWVANLLLLSAWIALARSSPRAAAKLSLAAALMMLTFFLIGDVPLGLKDANVGIMRFGPGYWLWVGSASAVAVGTSVFSPSENRTTAPRLKTLVPP